MYYSVELQYSSVHEKVITYSYTEHKFRNGHCRCVTARLHPERAREHQCPVRHPWFPPIVLAPHPGTSARGCESLAGAAMLVERIW